MIIGIAGVGVVGGALRDWLTTNTDHAIRLYDPPRGYTDDLTIAEAVFICVPVPTVESGQDLSIVKEILSKKSSWQRFYIRSTVLPGTCDALTDEFGVPVYAMPEFLTERTAAADVEQQGIVCGSTSGMRARQYAFLSDVFQDQKAITLMSNTEAELAKYMHNGNGTVKVAFNNLIYQLCQKMGANFDRVRQGALMSGYIGRNHTQVPGPDGKLGYGGKCFPKDMNALITKLGEHGIPCPSLVGMQSENDLIRNPSTESIWTMGAAAI